MKKIILSALLLVTAVSAFAQSNKGKDYFALGEYDQAKQIFESQLSTAPGESNYYLGEIAWIKGNVAEAKSFFEKGLQADPMYPLNTVGLAKVEMKNDQKQAELQLTNLLKKNKKNVEVNVAIARAYYDNGLKDLVASKVDAVRKIAKKSPLLYILEGDLLLAESSEAVGKAAEKYEQATYFDPSNVVAAVKCARVYESTQQPSSTDKPLAVEKLEPVLAAHPDYTFINRDIARAYNAAGKYKTAIECFVKYYGEGNCAFEDIHRLASAYYFTDQYKPSVVLLDKGLAQDPNNFVFNRLLMYNASKSQEVAEPLKVCDKFFSLKGNFIDKDWAAYGSILADSGRYQDALAQYDKVVAANPNKVDTYKELAPLYSKMKEYVKSAQAYEKYIELYGGTEIAESGDCYMMGRAWYTAGQQLLSDSTDAGKARCKEYLQKADTAFGLVCTKSPTSYIGFLWRGHANAAMDPETTQGLAKPYYEKALGMILKKVEEGTAIATFKKELLNIYKYEAFFYYLKEEKSKAKEDKDSVMVYCNKMLELDPANKTANDLINYYNPKPVTPAPAVKTTTKSAATTTKTPVVKK
jgi:tetratricopeptide (TPR) repeat protein